MRKTFENIRFLANRIFDVKYTYPAQTRKWAERTHQTFEHKTKDGLTFFLDGSELVDQSIFVEGIYEKRFLESLRGFFDPSAIALDIGANIGNHAIYLHRDFREIYCFEPNPETFRRLSRNVRANGISNLKLFQIALGDCETILPFRENLTGNLGNSGFMNEIVHADAGNVRVTPIPVRKADDFVESLEIPRIDLIKIDVEGFEPKVFNGLRKTIANHRPVVAFEFLGQLSNSDDFRKISDCLPDYGFYELVFSPAEGSVRDRILWYLRHGGRAGLKRFFEPEARGYDNILAFPDEASAARFVAGSRG